MGLVLVLQLLLLVLSNFVLRYLLVEHLLIKFLRIRVYEIIVYLSALRFDNITLGWVGAVSQSIFIVQVALLHNLLMINGCVLQLHKSFGWAGMFNVVLPSSLHFLESSVKFCAMLPLVLEVLHLFKQLLVLCLHFISFPLELFVLQSSSFLLFCVHLNSFSEALAVSCRLRSSMTTFPDQVINEILS